MIRKPIHENDVPTLAMADMLRADHQRAAADFFLHSSPWDNESERAGLLGAGKALEVLAASPGSQTANTLTVDDAELDELLEPITLDLIAALYEQAAEEHTGTNPVDPLLRAAKALRVLAIVLREDA